MIVFLDFKYTDKTFVFEHNKCQLCTDFSGALIFAFEDRKITLTRQLTFYSL